jgi:hypothetical protein
MIAALSAFVFNIMNWNKKWIIYYKK